MDSRLIGIGLYSIPEAAHLLRAQPREVRRWAFGYGQKGSDGRPEHAGVFDIPAPAAEIGAITFYGLLEARLVKGFRAAGVSLQSIRKAIEVARNLLDDPHPFICKRIQTDGRRIFAEAARETGDEALLDLLSRQLVFRKIVENEMRFGVDFDPKTGRASRWHPLRNSRAIVIDPARSFGSPVLTASGVPTGALFAAYIAEQENASAVARDFEVPAREVMQAVKYERSLLH